MSYFEKETWLNTKFIDCSPDVEEKYLKVVLAPIQDSAPSDSSFNLKIYKTDGLYRGVLDIKSAVKNFSVTCYDKEVYALTDKIRREMNWQIESWKETRFLRPAV